MIIYVCLNSDLKNQQTELETQSSNGGAANRSSHENHNEFFNIALVTFTCALLVYQSKQLHETGLWSNPRR